MKRIRLACVILLCALLLPFAMIFAQAESGQTVDADRFLFGAWSADSAFLSVTEAGTITAALRGAAPVIIAKQPASSRTEEGNALRIVLKNDSYCNLMRVTYVCGGETYEDQFSLERKGEKQDYYLYVSRPAEVTELHLAFSGGAGGSIELFGVGIVSLYDDSAEQPGEITECSYNAKTKTVTVSGTVRHNVASKTEGALVKLFAFEPGVIVEDVHLQEAEALAVSPLSIRFEFSVPADTFSLQFRQYIVALVGNDGTILHRFAPVFPSTPATSSRKTSAFKGISSEHVTAVVGADAQVAVVNVYLDRVESLRSNGLLSVEDGTYFYADRAYVRSLDDAVAQYRENGCRVYLRFLLSDEAEGGSFAPMTAESCFKDDTALALLAYTRFLCERYGKDSDALSGIIVGCSDDRQASGGQYAELYATALYVMSEAIRKSGVSAELILPVSDRSDHDAGDSYGDVFPTRVFIASICRAIEQRFCGNLSVGIMVESDATPSPIGAERSDRIATDRLADWESALHVLSKQYKALRAEYAYYWAPAPSLSPEEAAAAYVYNYYALMKSRASVFLVAPDGITDRETFYALLESVKYVNTGHGWTINQSAADLFGETLWNELLLGLSADAVSDRVALVYDEADASSVSVRGSSVLWDHKKGSNLYDWSVSEDGNLVLGRGAEGERVLSATFDGSALCSGIFYGLAGKAIMGSVDMLSVDLSLIGAEESEYELTFELCGETTSCVVNTCIKGGESGTIYLSTFLMNENDTVRNVRLLLRPLGATQGEFTVTIENLTAHSSTLDGGRLSAAISEAKREAVEDEWSAPDEPRDEETRKWVIFLIACVLGVSVIVVVNLAKRNEE